MSGFEEVDVKCEIKRSPSPEPVQHYPEDPEEHDTTETDQKPIVTIQPKAAPLRTAEMVNFAIKALSEKNGSSIQAIKKYMVETYNVDVNKSNVFIKKYLKSAVDAGFLIRTKGRGATGKFKIPGFKIDPLKAAAAAAKKVKPKKSTPEPATRKGKALNASVKETASPKKLAVKRQTKKRKARKNTQNVIVEIIQN